MAVQRLENNRIIRYLPFLSLFFLMLQFCNSSAPSEAQQDPGSGVTEPPEQVDENEGFFRPEAHAVFVQDGTALLGQGKNLVILDVSDPSSPSEIARVDVLSEVRDIRISGEHAFVAAGLGGVQVVNIRDRSQPRLVGNLATADRAEGLFVDGDRLCVAARTAGLLVVDISNPEAPRQLGAHKTLEEAMDVAVQDGLAYVAASFGGMRIIDVSQGRNPHEVGFATRNSYDQGYSWGVDVQDKHAFVANVEIGLRVVDIEDPSKAETIALFRLGMYNDQLYAPVALDAIGRYVYVADQSAGLRIIDVSQPKEPEEAGRIHIPGDAMDVQAKSNLAYVASKSGGLRIIDVSEARQPREIGFYNPNVVPQRVVLSSDIAFVSDKNDLLRVIDLRNPDKPVQIGMNSGKTDHLVTSGNTLYTVEASKGLRVIDISDPGKPREVGSLPLETFPTGIAISGETLYITDRDHGLRLIDVSDRFTPRERDLIATSRLLPSNSKFASALPELRGVGVSGNRAWIGLEEGLILLDVSQQRKPTPLNHYSLSGRVVDAAFMQESLLVSTDSELHLLSLTAESEFRPRGTYQLPGLARAVFAREETVYLADLDAGVQILNASKQAGIEKLTRFSPRYRILDMAMGQDYLLLAAGEAGLRVLSLSRGSEPQEVSSLHSTASLTEKP